MIRVPKTSPEPFACLRVGCSLVLLLKLAEEAPGFRLLYSNAGILIWKIQEAALLPWMPKLSRIGEFLSRFGVSQDSSAHLVLAVYTTCLVTLLVGFHSRLSSIGAWITHLVLFDSSVFSSYGADYFANMMLFYCVITPCGAVLSLDAVKRQNQVYGTISSTILLALARANLALAYFNSGYEKARGPEWWSGEALWRATMQPQFHILSNTWLAYHPRIAQAMTIQAVIIELGYIFFIWPRETRRIWLTATVTLHLGIAICLGLWIFSALAIVLNISLFGSELVVGVLRRAGIKFMRDTKTAFLETIARLPLVDARSERSE